MKAVAAAPDVSVAHQLLTGMIMSMDDRDGALVEYRRAAGLYDGEFRRLPGVMQEESPWSALARVELRSGNAIGALAAINHEIEGKPQTQVGPDIYLIRADIYEASGQAQNAADDYDRAAALLGQDFPQSAEYKVRAAALRASSGNAAAAGEAFRDIIRSGKLQSILRMQVFLNNSGFDEVPIDGKPSTSLDRALERCLADADCSAGLGRSI